MGGGSGRKGNGVRSEGVTKKWRYVTARQVEVKNQKMLQHNRQAHVLIRPDWYLIPPQTSLSCCTRINCSLVLLLQNDGSKVVREGRERHRCIIYFLLHKSYQSQIHRVPKCCRSPVEKVPNGACYIRLGPQELAFASNGSVSAKLLSEDPFALRGARHTYLSCE